MVLLLFDFTYRANFEHCEYPYIRDGTGKFVVQGDENIDDLRREIHEFIENKFRPSAERIEEITGRSYDEITTTRIVLKNVREATKWSELEN